MYNSEYIFFCILDCIIQIKNIYEYKKFRKCRIYLILFIKDMMVNLVCL